MDPSWRELLLTLQHLYQDDSRSHETYAVLKCLVKGSLDVKHRNNILATDLSMLSAFLHPLLKDIVNGDDHTVSLALEGLKLLRNVAAGVRDNQVCLINDGVLLSSVVDLCKCCSTSRAHTGLTFDLWKTALQLLGNLCVCYTEGQEKVWQLCSPDMFRCMFQSGSPEAINITCMVIFTCMDANSNCRIQFCESSGPDNLIAQFLGCLTTDMLHGLEWTGILLECVIVHVPIELLWQQCLLCETPPRQQLTLIQYILEKVLSYTKNLEVSVNRYIPTGPGVGDLDSVDKNDYMQESPSSTDGSNSKAEMERGSSQVTSGLDRTLNPPGIKMESVCDKPTQSETSSLSAKDCDLSTSNKSNSTDSDVYKAITSSDNLSHIQRLFTEHAQCLLTNDAAVLIRASRLDKVDEDNPDGLLVQLTKTILKVVNDVVQCEGLLGAVQKNVELLDTSLALLKQLSILDGSINSGRHRTKLSKTTPTGNEQFHPFFGFKRDLVRLLANLSYRNPDVQNRVNVLGAFPLVLNQCSIDHYNPYIPQWSVLAVRNLCERNPSNQRVIANLEQQVQVDTRKLLEDFGCEVEVGNDGKMKVKGAVKK